MNNGGKLIILIYMAIDKRRVLFVGGIPSSMTEDLIRDHFSKYDKIVNVRIMKDRKTKGSKGYAFVTLTDYLIIPKILAEPQVIGDRTVDVQVASRRGEKEKWKEDQKKRRLFVSNIPSHVNNSALVAFFNKFGEVRNAYVIRDFVSKNSLNYGYVEFVEPHVIDQILESGDISLDGFKLTCMPYQGKNQEKQHYYKCQQQKLGFKEQDYLDFYEEGCPDFGSHSYSDKFGRKPFGVTQRDTDPTWKGACTPIKGSLPVANSKYEYIGMSSKINQDESNYSFKIASGVLGRRGPLECYFSPHMRGQSTLSDPFSTLMSSMIFRSLRSQTLLTSGGGLFASHNLCQGRSPAEDMRKKTPACQEAEPNKQQTSACQSSTFKLFN